MGRLPPLALLGLRRVGGRSGLGLAPSSRAAHASIAFVLGFFLVVTSLFVVAAARGRFFLAAALLGGFVVTATGIRAATASVPGDRRRAVVVHGSVLLGLCWAWLNVAMVDADTVGVPVDRGRLLSPEVAMAVLVTAGAVGACALVVILVLAVADPHPGRPRRAVDRSHPDQVARRLGGWIASRRSRDVVVAGCAGGATFLLGGITTSMLELVLDPSGPDAYPVETFYRNVGLVGLATGFGFPAFSTLKVSVSVTDVHAAALLGGSAGLFVAATGRHEVYQAILVELAGAMAFAGFGALVLGVLEPLARDERRGELEARRSAKLLRRARTRERRSGATRRTRRR